MLRLLLIAATVAAAAPQPALRFELSSGAFEVTGLEPGELARLERLAADEWLRVFAVYVLRPRSAGDSPALLGSHRIAGERVRFEPRFPLQPGIRYRAVFRSSSSASPVEIEIELPAPSLPPTRLEAVYPSAAHVPENLLKIYLHFSAPMSRGEAYRRVRLLEAESRRAVELPFLELAEELWNREGTRLTLLLDPGRIKRGLRPREEEGPILEEGKRFILEVDAGWPDASGKPLAAGYRKEIAVGPPDERQPDPKRWKLRAPRSGARDPLVIAFPEPLDRALLERVITVVAPSGSVVAGEIAIDARETRWSFVPSTPWRPGPYRLRVAATLEDLAGNSVGRPFEVDRFQKIERRTEESTVELRFVVR